MEELKDHLFEVMGKNLSGSDYSGAACITGLSVPLHYIDVNPDTQIIFSSIIPFGGIAIYLFVNQRLTKQAN